MLNVLFIVPLIIAIRENPTKARKIIIAIGILMLIGLGICGGLG